MIKDTADLWRVTTGVLLIVGPLLGALIWLFPVPPQKDSVYATLEDVLSLGSVLVTVAALIGLLRLVRHRAVFWRLGGWLAVAGNALLWGLILLDALGVEAARALYEQDHPLAEVAVLLPSLLGTAGTLILVVGLWRAGIVHWLVPAIWAAVTLAPYLAVTFLLLLVLVTIRPVLDFIPLLLTVWIGVTVLRMGREHWISHTGPADRAHAPAGGER
ncbi:hypothetical protein FHS43_003270 [Streptosporangium becharense]|uniref:DUF4386 domain-containing protein n=1 Tax=Streptosporangium becharense TaxID=1816182 RepID=A0A7W9ID89_9ACTN|nr:hypothetical protein [Streptosporangium becharense]MBB2911990.1 hypothetical protein [Streptosporangium becharense]MBB5818537.1 hypothetical protein [Streptosporangium becharense]